MTHGSHSCAAAGLDDDQTRRLALIGRIAAGLAHELNGPIGVALGFTQLAREALQPAGISRDAVSKADDYLGMIQEAALRARSITRAIWEFSRAKPGTVGQFDLNEALAEAAVLAGPVLKVEQIDVRAEAAGVTGAAPLVRADRVVVVESLLGMFLAAPSALPQGGTVTWSASASNAEAIAFSLSAEPFGEAPAKAWQVPEWALQAIQAQGGKMRASLSGSGKTLVLPGWMPALEAAEQPAARRAG